MASDNTDRERDTSNGDCYGSRFLHREPLLTASYHIDQDPHRRRVLHDDGDRHAGPLNGDIIEIVRCRHSQHSQHETLDQVGLRQLNAFPSLVRDQQRQQNQQRKRGSRLGKDQWIDGMYGFPRKIVFPGKNTASEGGRNTPKKSRGADEKVSAPGVRALVLC